MNILLIGDIFGKSGIRAIKNELSQIKKQYDIDLTIANCENTTNCRGLSLNDYQTLVSLGIDFMTMGNHTWRQVDYKQVLAHNNIIRPCNVNGTITEGSKGYATIVCNNKKIRIINLMGESVRFNQATILNPFETLKNILNNNEKVDLNIVDFHAETTSEKNCMLRAFASQIQILCGTHTHVQTNDAQIYNHTAYITDLGMSGPCEGIIGARKDSLIEMFFGRETHFRLSEEEGKYQFCAVVVSIDDNTNLPTSIKNIYLYE